MTLKNSLSDKQSANGGVTLGQLTAKIIKRHIWLPLLALIGFILNLPVMTAMLWNVYADNASYFNNNRVEELVQVFQVGSSMIIIVGAALAAFTLFRYLQVRQQVDFYHSLPIRREKYFAANMLAGLLVFLAPYALAHLLNLLMMAMAGILPYLVLADYVQFVLLNILAYMLMFALTTLAMMLAGSMPAALKILVGIYGLAPAVGLLRELLSDVFYSHYLYGADVLNNLLTRASVLVRYCWISFSGYDWEYGTHIFWQDWLAGFVLLVLTVAAALWLYKKRSSECAGSTLAFGWQRPVFKYPYVLLCGCLGGIMFYAIGNENLFWLYFGVVIATTFFAQLLEIFIKSDFRAIRRGWPQVGICIVLVSAILGYYAFDIGKFDAWQAEADRVAAVHVDSNILSLSYNDYRYYGYKQYQDAYWQFGIDDYIKEHNMMSFAEPENVAALVSILNSQPQQYGYREYEDGDYYNWSSSRWVEVVYTLDNGRQVARSVNCADIFENADAYRVLLGSDEWQNQLFMYNDELDDYGVFPAELNNLGINDAHYYEPGKMTAAEGKEFVQVFTEEFAALSGEELLTGVPVANITLHFYESMEETEYGRDYTNSWYMDVSVYPGMPRTIQLIKKYYGDDALTANQDLYRLVSVVEYLPQPTEYTGDVTAKTVYEAAETTVTADVYKPYESETGFVEGVTMRNGIPYKSGRVLTPANNAAEIAELMKQSVSYGRIDLVRYYDIWQEACAVPYYEVTYKDDAEGRLIYEERYIIPDEAEYKQMMEQIRNTEFAY
ncbi:MAG: hypothetical protein IJE29_00880 [Firmicutes bacterium]|nr:hypothetical protein [Bacillota bacterium]